MQGRQIVVGVCGGIAAYKSVDLVRRLSDEGAIVSVILTDNATNFVGKATFAALTNGRVFTSLWGESDPSPHTMLGQKADAIIVAPATARLVGQYANGMSSDLLTSTLLATRSPVVVAPAMHTEMWEHPAVIANVAKLKGFGVYVVDPESGPLAGGDIGVGRLASTETLVDGVKDVLGHGDLHGLRVLVTAGGTREPIDPIRYIGNRSSGKQGYAVVEEAVARGARVTLITTVQRAVAPSVDVVEVETAAEMKRAVMQHLPEVDVVIMTAAVADFAPQHVGEHKIKKESGPPGVTLVPTDDILLAIAEERTPEQIIVGFAAETQNLEAAALSKLKAKKLDLIVANDVTHENAGMGHDSNKVLIVDKNGRQCHTNVISKRKVAKQLLDSVIALINNAR